MMTLDEAIKHCKDVALSCTNKECALEHFQLLKWLQEYSNMLEKQGNFPAKWEKNIANNKPALNHSVLMKNIHGIAEGEWNGKEWIQYRWSSKIKDSDVLYWMNLYELEKQGEQPQGKSALEAVKEEKVEPKFHEGDWTVSNLDGKARQISEVHFDECNSYYVVNWVCVNIEEYDRLYHLWNIEDAKDGDVLVDVYGNIGIFEKYDDFDWTSYCFSYKNGSFFHFKADHENEKTYPATQEQRDALFKAMVDAGYEFDFKKKKLEKIEQKSQRMVSAEAKEVLYDKLDWSEEDMSKVQRICKYLDEAKKYYVDITEVIDCIDWLKQLKQRIGWKPSKGQLECLSYAIDKVEKDYNPLANNRIYLTLKALKEQLEKL